MPGLEVHLVEGHHSPEQHAELLRRVSARYAEILGSEPERVRAVVTLHPSEHWAAGGTIGGDPAPSFTARVLEGCPVALRHRLLQTITDVLVDLLGVSRSRVHGRIERVDPDDWAVGGVPATRSG